MKKLGEGMIASVMLAVSILGLVAAMLLLVWMLASCRAPDRWEAGVGRGWGDVEGWEADRDVDMTTLSLGVSGPLTAPPLRVERPAPAVDLAPVLDELCALRASLEAPGKGKAPGAVETGAAQAGVLALAAGVALAGLRGYAAWKAARGGA